MNDRVLLQGRDPRCITVHRVAIPDALLSTGIPEAFTATAEVEAAVGDQSRAHELAALESGGK